MANRGFFHFLAPAFFYVGTLIKDKFSPILIGEIDVLQTRFGNSRINRD